MCGIVGYIGPRQATPILVNGLRRLEYRGYDSAGVSVWDGKQSQVVRCEGKLRNLELKLETEPAPGKVGIGHTRWATHGRPSDTNAHPHKVGSISVVHNGIIENHMALRRELESAGAKFTSETDTEIVAHLVNAELANADGLTDATLKALKKVQGAYALLVMDEKQPDVLVAAKNASPLVIGLGEDENFIASDVTAILDETKEMIFVEEGQVVTVRANEVKIVDLDGKPQTLKSQTIRWNAAQAEKNGFRHYMQKEIHEQPRAVADTLAGRVDLEHDTVNLGVEIDTSNIKRIIMVACGTSYHASMVGKFLIEDFARIPVEVDLASEYRYRNPVIRDTDLVIAVSQSGETADTMGAVQLAKAGGAKVLAISNVLESSIPRLADYAFYTHAGPEIGVASTKAFTTQLVSMTLIAIHLGRQTGTLKVERARELLHELIALPNKMADLIEHGAQLQVIARRYGHARGFLFMGRGAQYPIALEGALKLKEISYIHAEGYSAGEMKHGPIALIDDELPVVVLVPKGPLYEKVVSNLTEVRAREGKVIAIASRGDKEIGSIADEVVMIPNTLPELQPILSVVPLQQLSYYVADFKGTDIDQPRNLAKSVTVE